jgi:hypothetical protein
MSRLCAALLGLLPIAAPAQPYRIEKVPTPAGLTPEIGALAALPDGRLAAAFHHGQVAFYDPQTQAWQLFAEGLHEPLGLLAEPDGSLLALQRAELTRLRDTDGDGAADHYATAWDGFGLTGNYHEYNYGPLRTPEGKWLVALNCASNADTIFREVRGAWNPAGLAREKFYGEWKKIAPQAGRMFARVPWRGCVVEVDPATGATTLLASGFRSPDGLGYDAAGRLLVTDQQGDWRGTNEVHVVKRGGFHGHPASLIWRDDWDGSDPVKVPVERLQKLRTLPAIQLPYGRYANSPTQPVVIPKTPAWGAFGGQTLIGEMNSPRLLRIGVEQVAGLWQGWCAPLLESPELKRGLHRFAFLGDTLYVGRLHLAWAGDEGIGALTPVALPFDPLEVKITPAGFRLTFTEPLAPSATETARWSAERYTYRYHAEYGSPETDKSAVVFTRITLSPDAGTAQVEVADLRPGFIYDFDLSRLASAQGVPPLNPRIAYTANRLPEPASAAAR